MIHQNNPRWDDILGVCLDNGFLAKWILDRQTDMGGAWTNVTSTLANQIASMVLISKYLTIQATTRDQILVIYVEREVHHY